MNAAQSAPKPPEDGWLHAIQSFTALLPIGIPFPITQAIARLANAHGTSSLAYIVAGLYLLWKLRHRFIYTVVLRDASCQKLMDAFANKPWTNGLRMASVDINTPIPPATTLSLNTSPTYRTSALFWYGWVPLWIRVDAYDERKQDPFATISCLFSPGPIRRFLEQYPAIHAQQELWLVDWFRLEKGFPNPWTRGQIPRREIKSVARTEHQKAIQEEVEQFFTLGHFYAKRGVPFRKGFLFHGPPGTGKSSMVIALASHFGLPIRTIPLSSGLTDIQFQNLMSRFPSRCVVLFEDIDAAGLGRGEGSTKGISLSVFLNALDRILGGSLIIMTANNPSELDSAMTRPGRIDHRVEFSYATKNQAAQLFRWLMFDPEDDEKDKQENLVETFCNGIPDGTLTTAQIQNYLMGYHGNPVGAAERVRELVEEWVQKEAAMPRSTD